MGISYDPAKNLANIRKHGLSFELCHDFDWDVTLTVVDNRKDYGETRYVSIGYLGERLHVVCYVETFDGVRVMSFRKANDRERKKYEKATYQ